MRLTDQKKIEFSLIIPRVETLNAEFFTNTPLDQHRDQISRLNFQHGDELESYQVKLENFYSETDVKEQTFQDF